MGLNFMRLIWKVSAYSLDSELTECMLNVKRKRSRTETWTMHMFNKVEMKKERPGSRLRRIFWRDWRRATEAKGKLSESVLIAQSCTTVCNPVDCSPPGCSVNGFSRQEYWHGLPWPSPGDFPNPGIKPVSPVLQADSLPLSPQGSP